MNLSKEQRLHVAESMLEIVKALWIDRDLFLNSMQEVESLLLWVVNVINSMPLAQYLTPDTDIPIIRIT